MDTASVLLRYGSIPLRICDYRDGGFQLEGRRNNATVGVAFTPTSIDEAKVSDQGDLFALLSNEGSVWVTVLDPVMVFDDEMEVDDVLLEVVERRGRIVLVG